MSMSVEAWRATVKEHDLQVTVLEQLERRAAPGVFWFAVPNAGKRGRLAARMLKEEGMRAGVADLCVMLPAGKVAWLELKTRRGRQTEQQVMFGLVCASLNHPYHMARTLDEAVGFLKQVGALR